MPDHIICLASPTASNTSHHMVRIMQKAYVEGATKEDMDLQVKTPEGGSPAHETPPNQEMEQEDDAARGGSQDDVVFMSFEEHTSEEEFKATEPEVEIVGSSGRKSSSRLPSADTVLLHRDALTSDLSKLLKP